MSVLNAVGRLMLQRETATLIVNVTLVQICKHCSLQLWSNTNACRFDFLCSVIHSFWLPLSLKSNFKILDIIINNLT